MNMYEYLFIEYGHMNKVNRIWTEWKMSYNGDDGTTWGLDDTYIKRKLLRQIVI